MNNFKFVIPIKLEDLTKGSGDYHVYSVTTEYNTREIGHKLNDCNDNLRSNGPQFIIEDFDVFYSFLRNFTALESKHKEMGSKIISRALIKLESDLQMYFNDTNTNSTPEDRQRLCNILKMLVYVFCTMAEAFEDHDNKQKAHVDVDSDGKKRKKQIKKSDESYDWAQSKEKGLDILLRLYSLPLHRIFNPPIVEDDFVNTITKCCYKVLENPVLSRQKESNLCQSVFHILGNAIEKHRHNLSFCLKIIQLLQHKEQLVSILAHLFEVIVKTHSQRIIISEIIREIRRIDTRDLSRDSSGPRAISSFLVEVSDRCPLEIMSSISDILDFLEEDSYLMRNATLSIIGNLVVKELSEENLELRERNLRDELLDKLEEHIHDNTSYTRSKALQVWSMLCQSDAIPIPRLETLIVSVVGRLRDKSCFVRKSAVQFLTQFLAKNPFAAKLPLHLLQKNHRQEEEKLRKMILLVEKDKDFNQQMDTDNDNRNDLQEVWYNVEAEFVQFWRERKASSTSADDDDDSQKEENNTILSECNDVEEVFQRIRDLITEKIFKSALSLLRKAKNQWPNDSILNEEDEYEDDEEDEDMTFIEEESKIPPLPYVITLAKRVFLAPLAKNQIPTLDLGSKAVEKDIVRVATVLIQGSQNEGETKTTTIEIANDSMTETAIVNDISKQQILVKYLHDCVKFTEQIQIAIPFVCDLLLSRNSTDILAAIDFFVTAYQFGCHDAITGVRRMIVLIWSQEKPIKDAVISAYKQIYLDSNVEFDDENTCKSRAAAVVKSLSLLVKGATLGELISIEQLLKEFMKSGEIQQIHIQVMWERYSLKLSGTTQEESRAAIQLIGMLASANPELVRTNLSTLIAVGLGDRGMADSRLVRETCIAIGKAYRLPKVESCELFFRLPKDHELFKRISDKLNASLTDVNDKYWVTMCNEMIKVIFQIAESPDWVCEQLIRHLITKLLSECQSIQNGENENKEKPNDNENVQNDAEHTEPMETEESNFTSQQTMTTDNVMVTKTIENIYSLNSDVLGRFITLLGDVALNVLVHLDLNILTEVKIRNYIKEEKERSKNDKTPKRRSKTVSKTPNVSDRNLEEEIGLQGANAIEDQEQEFINQICNDDIVFGKNLLTRLSEMIVKVVEDPVTYPDVKLRTSACLALAKFMAVSEPFCRLHLRLLVTVMDKAQESAIRGNTLIALGDLCVRFPNLLDQWSPQMFQRLRDTENDVKMSALRVLSRLILSDMVKVKGQISEMAVLIVDDDDRLSSAAKLFFTELGKKQNAIYNILPDIISHLSDTNNGIEEEKFRIVMKYCFELIEKDRQITCLVTRICERFRATTDERQWRDLAYCLSLLNHSERSIQKLVENLICFADKLFSDFVYECISLIITNAKKIPNLRVETKQIIEDFELKVNECRNKGMNEDDSEFQRVVGTPPSASKRASNRRVASSAKKFRNASNSKNCKSKTKTQRKAPPIRRPLLEEDSDDDDDGHGHDVPKEPVTRERPSRNAKPKARIIESSSEESE